MDTRRLTSLFLMVRLNNSSTLHGRSLKRSMLTTLLTSSLALICHHPISMMVSLDWVKLLQGNFMQDDHTMFDKEQDMETRAQSSNLNEELGQVEYVFSDKTGTLTCNIMEFKKFTAGKRFYGLDEKPTTK